jgi:flagellum-specific ATP synthase
MNSEINFSDLRNNFLNFKPYLQYGKITKSLGLIFEAYLPSAAVGSICQISKSNGELVLAEVIGFREKKAILMPYEETSGIDTQSLVSIRQVEPVFPMGSFLLGRVIDGLGIPIDGKGPLFSPSDRVEYRGLYQRPSHPLDRVVVSEPIDLGIRAINGLLTCGKGQRVGIMAGSGVGKSVLLGMISRNTSADVNVIALIGERGREVREFIERDLGPEGLARSVVIVSTSDRSPLLRMRGAFLAAAISEYFRDQQQDVLLLMDSLTRFSMAQREIGLSMGEPPATKGYTPSVFATLPKLLERAGTTKGKGSITGLYTVLVEGDDLDDPIGDAARSILDGHIVLSRKIAQKNHFPAIDVLQSASRVMRSITDPSQQELAGKIKQWMATYAQSEDLINIGAYVRGNNPELDLAVLAHDKIKAFLRQNVDETAKIADTFAQMSAIVRSVEAMQTSLRK